MTEESKALNEALIELARTNVDQIEKRSSVEFRHAIVQHGRYLPLFRGGYQPRSLSHHG